MKNKKILSEIKIIAIPFLIISAAFFLAVYMVFGKGGKSTNQESLASGDPDAPAGSAEKFDYLVQQSSNGCGLQQASVFNYPDEQRIQGSCCDKMDRQAYQQQIEELKQYAAIKEIPTDPYDISAAEAKVAYGFLDSITLTPEQQAVYNEAMELSMEGGPCCCKCWHWDVYEGLAKKMIVSYDWDAGQVADLWDHSDACGGAQEHG